MTDAVVVDGSQGEGGGQVLRTALALSLATGRPLRMERIRAGRPKRGLRPQHLASVRLARQVGDAEVEGDRVGSSTLEFRPRGLVPGRYDVDVGTAGSATLVLQTVLPPLLTAPGPTSLAVTGGTHNPWAPPFDFLERVYLPRLRSLGCEVEARLVRPGFAPTGGGRIEVEVRPCARLGRLEALERGEVRRRKAEALIAHLPRHVAERELKVVARRLGWPEAELFVREEPKSAGPGNALSLEIACEHATEVFFEPGRIGVRAETVALRAVAEASAWLGAGVPVGVHQADQLLLPLALGAGGTFRTLPLSSHAKTQIELIRRFVDATIEVEPFGAAGVTVRVR